MTKYPYFSGRIIFKSRNECEQQQRRDDEVAVIRKIETKKTT